MESNHKVVYQTWAEKNKFPSMLPRDAQKRHRDVQAASEAQSCLDSHLREKPQKERIVPYTDKIFHKQPSSGLCRLTSRFKHLNTRLFKT
ncbi:hypothetical protein L208DRAFT_1511437 [Tricholoma matsutake]|nr:hypothetical protein L208DRAFT_1511437 [Tricholoma matsutake 945]